MSGLMVLSILGFMLVGTMCLFTIINRICECVEKSSIASAYEKFLKEVTNSNVSSNAKNVENTFETENK